MASEVTSVWMYEPSFPLAVVGCVVYGLILFAIGYFTLVKYQLWYFSVIVVGAAVEVVAYITRAYSAKNQSEIAPFVVTLTTTVLAPVFIAAANYMLITRLIISVLPESRHRILGIPGRRLTLIFVICDIVAFCVQGNGSAVASSNDWTGKEEKIGRYILIGGLSFQLLTFSLFLCVLGRFHHQANRHELHEAPAGWRKVVTAVYISSALIVVRCIFRAVEFAEGMDGYAFRTEWLFWVFEALLMALAIVVFCFYHPGQYLAGVSVRRWRRARKLEGSDDNVALQNHS